MAIDEVTVGIHPDFARLLSLRAVCIRAQDRGPDVDAGEEKFNGRAVASASVGSIAADVLDAKTAFGPYHRF